MPPDAAYSIADLARLTGLNVRTIRYYLAQGLIPASGESGPGAHYGAGHLDRLRLTKRLQAQHLPLSEIRARLGELTDDDAANLVADGEAEAPRTTSALDYIRAVLGATADPRGRPEPSPTLATSITARPGATRLAGGPTPGRLLTAARLRMPATGIARDIDPSATRSADSMVLESNAVYASGPATPVPSSPTEPQSLERSQWERLSLGPNLELHIRRPLSRLEQRRVERLLTIARQVLNEDQS